MPESTKRAAEAIRGRIASLGSAIAAADACSLAEDRVVRALDALAAALDTEDVTLFVDHVRCHDGEPFVPAARRVLAEALPSSLSASVTAYVDAAAEQLATSRQGGRTSERVGAGPSTEALRQQYLDALIQGSRQEASRMILQAVDAGMGVREVYEQVFQPALHEVGLLWQRNRVTVAQEHYITAATQLIMSQLYPRIFSTHRRGRRFVATCVSGELHEVGVRMVADFFEMDGWDTYYLGANVPPEDVVRELRERRAEVLGVSATLAPHISQVADMIGAAQRDQDTRAVKTLVGGQAFVQQPDAWRRVGADAHAGSAGEAVRIAHECLDA